MVVTHTFSLFLVLKLLTFSASCYVLDIGKIESYANGDTIIGVDKAELSIKFYGHSSGDPFLLKEIYNGNVKLQFDPLLTRDQLLLSASVYWVSDVPSVVQLNLEKSSVVLLNEDNSLVSIEAIFSGKTITNTSGRTHLKSDQVVDVDLSKFKDYTHNSKTVPVTELKLTGDKFRRYKLRSYNLESVKLGTLKYDNQELKTVVDNSVEGNNNREVTLVLPNKDDAYALNVYSYNNFPLLMEVLYTYNIKLFYGFTPDLKWHQVYLPSFNDPSHSEFLYKKLNYYACKNGFKYTIDISKVTTSNQKDYTISNHCNISNGVDTFSNRLVLEMLDQSVNPKYDGYEHKPEGEKLFFVDHIMSGNSPIIFEETPIVIKSIQVFYNKDTKQLSAIGFLTPEKNLVSYKIIGGEWRLYYTNLEQHKGKDIMVVDGDPVNLLPETARIFIDKSSKHRIRTVKKDLEYFDKKEIFEGKINIERYFNSPGIITWEGPHDRLLFKVKDITGIYYFSYSTTQIVNWFPWPNIIYGHCFVYSYNYEEDRYYLDVYTNLLYRFRFRSTEADRNAVWELVHWKPIKIYDDFDTNTRSDSEQDNDNNSRPKSEQARKIDRYFASTRHMDFEKHSLHPNHLELLPDEVTIIIENTEEQEINTIKKDRELLAKGQFTFGLYDTYWYNWYNNVAEYVGNFYGTLKVKTKENVGFRPVLYYYADIIDLKKLNVVVHYIYHVYDYVTNDMFVDLYTDSLYVYRFTLNYKAGHYKWTFIERKPATIINAKDPILLKYYFETTKDLDNFKLQK